MYQFTIKKQEEGGYKFELDGIRMIIDGYSIKEDKHYLTKPDKAIAYFLVDDNIYGISNDPLNFNTAVAFYDAIIQQYQIFTHGGKAEDMINLQHTA